MPPENRPNNIALDFYEKSYLSHGFSAQRKYPNEELARFMGRNLFGIAQTERASHAVLEVGCGSGANLWMIAKEGFQTFGIDFSKESLNLATKMLDSYNTRADLRVADMSDLPFENAFFDTVVDVLGSCYLNQSDGIRFLHTVNRVLKKGGLFFSYFPSKSSDAFTNKGDSELIDADTLSGITRKDSPYAGCLYPHRFLHPRQYELLLRQCGFSVKTSESITKTYNNRQEIFEMISIEAIKTDTI